MMSAVSRRVVVGIFDGNLLLPSLSAPLQCLPHSPPLRLPTYRILSIYLYLYIYICVMRAWTNVLAYAATGASALIR